MASADVIFSSLPHDGRAGIGVTLDQSIAVQFTPQANFRLSSVKIPFTLLDSTIARSLNVELWNNKQETIYSVLQNRPGEILGAWLSTPITQLGAFAPAEAPTEVVASALDGPLLETGQRYWIKVTASWETLSDPLNGRSDPINAQWGESVLDYSVGSDLPSIVGFWRNEPDCPKGCGLVSPNYLAFQVEGVAVVPEPETFWLVACSLPLIWAARRRALCGNYLKG